MAAGADACGAAAGSGAGVIDAAASPAVCGSFTFTVLTWIGRIGSPVGGFGTAAVGAVSTAGAAGGVDAIGAGVGMVGTTGTTDGAGQVTGRPKEATE
jgi:hypothetical protein